MPKELHIHMFKQLFFCNDCNITEAGLCAYMECLCTVCIRIARGKMLVLISCPLSVAR